MFPRPAAFSLRGVFVCKKVNVMNLNFIRNLSQTAKGGYRWLGLVSLLAGLIAWWVVARFSGLPAFVLPSPLQVWQRFLLSLTDGELAQNTAVTLVEILLGLLWGAVFAVVLGYLLAKSRHIGALALAISGSESGGAAGRDCAAAGHLVWTWDVF